MIVPSMTAKEIYYELLNDLPTLNKKLQIFKKDFRRKALKASNFPYTKTYECFSRLRKNLVIITCTAIERGHAGNPFLGTYGIYSRPEGNYVAEMTLNIGEMTIYPPHFFKRYRERILKDIEASNNDIIRRFVNNSWGFIAANVSEDQATVFKSHEVKFHDEPLSFAAATYEGYCFGERQGNINIMKTIISDDMLFDNQKRLFTTLRVAFNERNKLIYGKEINRH